MLTLKKIKIKCLSLIVSRYVTVKHNLINEKVCLKVSFNSTKIFKD